ncbi:HINT domain-containing protein [Tuwongella immobilis]|uniref:HINT domain-containing protein n=1 Tax=Tuwongella immobilis TaxID=692036 RepID=UPI0021BCB4AD|nr:HINT domain-containing protein [Tuwongella immobilis]
MQPSDLVYSRDEHDPHAPIEARVIEEIFTRYTRVLHLTVAGETIRTTGEHSFWSDRSERGIGWAKASELVAGDRLLAASGEWLTIDAAEEPADDEVVYNCRVAEWHTYFVGDDAWGWAVWAHNAYVSLTEESQQFVLRYSETAEILRERNSAVLPFHNKQAAIDFAEKWGHEIVSRPGWLNPGNSPTSLSLDCSTWAKKSVECDGGAVWHLKPKPGGLERVLHKLPGENPYVFNYAYHSVAIRGSLLFDELHPNGIDVNEWLTLYKSLNEWTDQEFLAYYDFDQQPAPGTLSK